MKKAIFILAAAMVAFAAIVPAEAMVAEPSEVSAKPKKEYKTVVFHVHLHCKDCVKKVQENIAFEKGVKDLEVSLENQTVKITYDPAKTDEAKLKTAIEKLGYEVHGKKYDKKE